MAPTLLDTFRILSSFSPTRQSLADAPWDAYVKWAIANGLAALSAYNLEYRLAGGDAPEWARDQLLSVYQGTANDNVMKLVNFKRVVDKLEGRKVLVLGGASFAEVLYPHVAFRPIIDISLMLPPQDIDAFAGFLAQGHFRPAPHASRPRGAVRSLTDGRTPIHLFAGLFGSGFEAEDRALFDRAIPTRVYGPSFFRLALEDALLALCLEQARAGYEVPYVSFVDLRELLLGAPAVGGPYSKAPDLAALRARANALKLGRALYASFGIAAGLFPEIAAARELAFPLPRFIRWILDGVLVHPLSRVGRKRATRGADRLRRVLAGGRSASVWLSKLPPARL
jgi:Uncharacterised nucleotidyltransferase